MAYSSDEDDDDFYCSSCERTFISQQALQAHLSQSSRHHYCIDCERDFTNENSLRQHRASKRHQAPIISCPSCRSGFVSASALTKHIEVGGCYNITNRQIVRSVREWEERIGQPNLLTIPQIGWQNRDIDDDSCTDDDSCIDSTICATERSYNGTHYVCPICDRGFPKLLSLNQHLNSSAHEPSEFRCKKCGRQFRVLSALVEHVEKSSRLGKVFLAHKKGESFVTSDIAANLRTLKMGKTR
ncbi:hypothetical protein GOP47_0011381 [Adiantum capillus-veneris]|uniref:C2H2-type domain-containing protein n=1 Tax=Adiantum capillus-veneris TaxID=13818 RepID=A0A9D4UU42_ADICA|nr:hypothetical protein GOP47_0011381 [Adiantum capillus-veneris]